MAITQQVYTAHYIKTVPLKLVTTIATVYCDLVTEYPIFTFLTKINCLTFLY